MAFPSLENGPWTFNVNNVSGEMTSNNNFCRWAYFNMKDVLVSFSQWSIVASGNGTTGKNIGDADPDTWIDSSDVVFGSSWFIAQNSVTGEQLCFDSDSTTGYYAHMRYSATGDFATTGGTASAPPSATEVVTLIDGTFTDSTTRAGIINAMVSNDGKCTRLLIVARDYNNWGKAGMYFALEELVDTPAVWTSTYKRCACQIQQPTPSLTNYNQSPKFNQLDGQIWYCHLKDASPSEGNYLVYPTSSCFELLSSNSGDPVGRRRGRLDFSFGYAISPIGVFRPDADHGGGIGRMQDIGWAPTKHEFFQTYDQPTTRAWIKLGALMLPWDGSKPAWI